MNAVWYGDSLPARAGRTALAPASWLYCAGVAVRNRMFDHDGNVIVPAVPALSIGNITVGGTGKTPVAAWAAACLAARGARPAIVMRGYGNDERLVHARLNPGVPVITDADRVRGAAHARDAGADCVILDDAFQHRRVARVSDWVLISAEQWSEKLRVLPAGPLREPLDVLVRADMIIVTRKTASHDVAGGIGVRLGKLFPRAGLASMHLTPAALVNALTGERRSIAELAGRRVLAVAAIGAPQAFFGQLRDLGAKVHERAFRDHYAFSETEVRSLLSEVSSTDVLVCTLKDAVKLAPLWAPTSAPLWYVSQIAIVEQGRSLLDDALESVLAARQPASLTAGPAGPSSPGHGH